MSRARWPLGILGVAGLLLLAWLLGGQDRNAGTPAWDPETAAGDGDEAAPMLTGSAPRRAGARSDVEAGGPEHGPSGDPAQPRPETWTFRLVGPEGQPSGVRNFVVKQTRADGRAERTVHPLRDGGVLAIEFPDGTPIALEIATVDSGAPGAAQTLLRWEAAGGEALDTSMPLEVTLATLWVRTVDSRGDPRPGQRVLYRPLDEQGGGSSWWGRTSDADAWLRLGPFPREQVIEMRPGWRGLRGKEIENDPSAWHRFRADRSPVELFVGDQPRLILRFPRTGEDTVIPIRVLEAETGKSAFPQTAWTVGEDDWVAPALAEDRAYEVVVGPTGGGLFARQQVPELTGHPVEVLLTQGLALSGRVESPTGAEIVRGQVVATGRGIALTYPVAAGGTFAFPGLPDEVITLEAHAEFIDAEGARQWFRARGTVKGETWTTLRPEADDERRKPTEDGPR